MSFEYSISPSIDLFVRDRISEDDAARQTRTVKAVLEKLKGQPGLILADEVGMGKTFVALAVAVSVYLKEKRSTVIMIPPNLVEKWPNDFRLFCEACITDPSIRKQLRCGIARRPEEFLRFLDDDEQNRCAIIFLTHGALTRSMGDGWIKLAILQKALYRRHNIDDILRSLKQHAGALIEKQGVSYKDKSGEIWGRLLNTSPEKWKKMLNDLEQMQDDPVPSAFLHQLNQMASKDLESLYHDVWNELPRRNTDTTKEKLTAVRKILSDETKRIWTICLSKIQHDLPLLIFDEAHHLKNSQTQLVTKLFQEPEAEEEAGLLAKQFDRMLFLTATPFQLGHHELLNVLQRFSTINWESPYAPPMTSSLYKEELNNLLKQLDHSQLAARRLDNSWGKLKESDLAINRQEYHDVYSWWSDISKLEPSGLSISIQKVLEDFKNAKQKLQDVESLLKKYVIRHLKPKMMGEPFPKVPRRNLLAGHSILASLNDLTNGETGLEVNKESILPFLLAARLSAIQPDKRPVFAEGLASSFEAFRFTREAREKAKHYTKLTDIDDDPAEIQKDKDPLVTWYLEELDESLKQSINSQHPKLKPTIDKAIELWSKGEKVLIFCHYIATGRALRKYISTEMRGHIRREGAQKFMCSEEEVFEELEKIANRITSPESPLHRVTLSILNDLLEEFPELESIGEEVVASLVRYMKTPSFLVRFALKTTETNEAWLVDSFNAKDESGISLREMLRVFLKFLSNRKEDREAYVAALKSIQPGGIRAADVTEAFENDEHPEESESVVMANVRLCYGATKPETRQKLMKTFNTPFFPDILITSSVMAEGVDLHLNCRHIIHHDLSWNPSTLEQRTGRVDRIGAKAERCGKSIYVYLPYLSQTQDEKMYRVVTERERWFNIIMGEKYKVDAFSTDKYAERIPLPQELAEELAFRLDVD